jgi:hypothetical protein
VGVGDVGVLLGGGDELLGVDAGGFVTGAVALLGVVAGGVVSDGATGDDVALSGDD